MPGAQALAGAGGRGKRCGRDRKRAGAQWPRLSRPSLGQQLTGGLHIGLGFGTAADFLFAFVGGGAGSAAGNVAGGSVAHHPARFAALTLGLLSLVRCWLSRCYCRDWTGAALSGILLFVECALGAAVANDRARGLAGSYARQANPHLDHCYPRARREWRLFSACCRSLTALFRSRLAMEPDLNSGARWVIAVAGGLVLSQILTLYTTPVIY